MTPPMTPREKVAVFDPCPGCGADEPRNRCLGCGHDFAPRNRQAILDGSPVTALASGSGDHADHSGDATKMRARMDYARTFLSKGAETDKL